MRRQNRSCDQCRKAKRACDAPSLWDIKRNPGRIRPEGDAGTAVSLAEEHIGQSMLHLIIILSIASAQLSSLLLSPLNRDSTIFPRLRLPCFATDRRLTRHRGHRLESIAMLILPSNSKTMYLSLGSSTTPDWSGGRSSDTKWKWSSSHPGSRQSQGKATTDQEPEWYHDDASGVNSNAKS